MATVVCNNPSCKFRKAVYCDRDFTLLNQFGMCDIWFDKNGGVRQAPLYPVEVEPEAVTEHQPPKIRNTEATTTFENEKTNGEESENTKEENGE